MLNNPATGRTRELSPTQIAEDVGAIRELGRNAFKAYGTLYSNDKLTCFPITNPQQK